MKRVGPPHHPIADLKAQSLAAWVADASDERLARVMRGPLRRVLLWQIFRTMGQRFDPERAEGIDAVVEFQVKDGRDGRTDHRQVTIADGRCTTSARRLGEPTLTVAVGPVAFLKLVSGESGPRRLMVTGRLRVRGDLRLALRLPGVLGVPRQPTGGG
jgi:putative sterol carrier protein